jgi:hypothetical protein
MSPPNLNQPSYDALMGIAETQTDQSRVNQSGPGGSSTWTNGPDGRATQQVSLSPQAQAAYDAQTQAQTGRNQLGASMMGNAGAAMSSPFSLSGLPAAPDAQGARNQAINGAYGQATSRLDPQWQQTTEQTQAQLYNQGLRPGDKAYDDAMGNMSRQKNDAYTSAMNSAIGQGTAAQQSLFSMGQQAHQTGLSDLLTQRNEPLSEMNSVMNGQGVNVPGYGPAQQNPNLLGAEGMGMQGQIATSNAQQAYQNSMINGAGSLLKLFALGV